MTTAARRRAVRLIFILYAIAPLGLSASWRHVRSTPLAVPRPSASMPPGARDFLLREHAVVTREIQARIQHEHLLFVLKFTVVGAVLGLIFRSNSTKPGLDELTAAKSFSGILTPGMALVCWSAVGVSAIIDVRIFFNAALIHEAGAWVRVLEDGMTAATVPGWETALAASEMWRSRAYPLLVADRQLLTWVLYLVTLYLFVPRDLPGNRGLQRELLKLAAGALPICVLLFSLVGLSFHVGHPWLGWHVAIAVALAAGATLWLTWSLAALEPPETAETGSG